MPYYFEMSVKEHKLTFKALCHSSHFFPLCRFPLSLVGSVWQIWTQVCMSWLTGNSAKWDIPNRSQESGGMNHVIPWPALCLLVLWAWFDMKCITQKAEHCCDQHNYINHICWVIVKTDNLHITLDVYGKELRSSDTNPVWKKCGNVSLGNLMGKKTSLDALLLPWPLTTWVDRTNTGVQQVNVTSMVISSCCCCHLPGIPSSLGCCSICERSETICITRRANAPLTRAQTKKIQLFLNSMVTLTVSQDPPYYITCEAWQSISWWI